jgi:hypothetical protein
MTHEELLLIVYRKHAKTRKIVDNNSSGSNTNSLGAKCATTLKLDVVYSNKNRIGC